MELELIIARLKEYLSYCTKYERPSVELGIKILEQAQANGGAIGGSAPPVSTLVGKREKWV